MNIAIGASPVCYAKGGTERVATAMAAEFAARGHSVHLFAFDHGRPPVFPLAPEVRLHLLPEAFWLGAHAEIVRVRQCLTANAVDVFISLQSEWTHMLWALCCLGTGTPFICSERSDPRFSEAVTWNRPGRMAVLASADVIHELVDAHIQTIPEIHRHKAVVIPNAAPPCAARANAGRDDGRGTVLFLARFIPGKRADLLLRSFALLARDFPGWTLRLAGYGPEESALRSLAASLGLSERTNFAIAPESWQRECAAAQIYCLPTRVEGFPNSVLEAMACGLPVIGLDDCPAMTGIVRHGVNGLLAKGDTPQALAEPLRALMASASLRQRLADNALKDCATTYSAPAIWDRWEQLARSVAARRGQTVMDSFAHEPFASMATLSAAARREYLYRNFNDPMPGSLAWYTSRLGNLAANLRARLNRHAHLLPTAREALALARKGSWRRFGYFYRQIEKTRRMNRVRKGEGDKRTRAFGAYLAEVVALNGKTVLCVGCGSERELQFFREAGARPVGIDLHAESGKIRALDMQTMDFAPATFDVVYSCHSFEHCTDQRAAAGEFLRVLKPGGFLALEVPLNARPDAVDLHSCPDAHTIRSLFTGRITAIVREAFVSRTDPANPAGEDVYRFIYQVGDCNESVAPVSQ